MVYLFIGLVLMMLIAPIVSILPGKSQKQIMAVRRAAMARGISVELTTIDGLQRTEPDEFEQCGPRGLPSSKDAWSGPYESECVSQHNAGPIA